MKPTNNKPPPSKRRPGAPKGNLNALKHGFYSKQIRSLELDDLQESFAGGLDDEISMMRVLIRRAVGMGSDIDNLDSVLHHLNTVSRATAQLSRLLRVQQFLGRDTNEIVDALTQALADVHAEGLIPKK